MPADRADREALADVDADAEPLRASSLLEFLGYCRIAGPDSEAPPRRTPLPFDAARVEPVSSELARALTGMSLVQSGQGHYQDAIATAEEGRGPPSRSAPRPYRHVRSRCSDGRCATSGAWRRD